VPAVPSGKHSDVPAVPSGKHSDVPADLFGHHGGVPSGPLRKHRGVPADLCGNHGAVPVGPSGVRSLFSPAFGLAYGLLIAPVIVAAIPMATSATVPLETTAGYESTPLSHVATGGAFADVDGDGWLDMVVANGNDISRQHVAIYHNLGNGQLPPGPSWESSDLDYNGHLDLGDVDGDGFLDLVVSTYIGTAGFSQPGHVKLYLGDGVGHFSSQPDWVSAPFYTFSCALGDADGDGDLDLAVACGEDYNNVPDRQRIFYNVNGRFDQVPPWESDDIAYALDVFWDDIDLDGDLDVVFCGTSSPLHIYENAQTDGGGISTSATWQNTDLPEYGNTTAFGDWNGDGLPELAVADNFQLGGTGKFKVYANSAGSFPTTPTWTSANGGYGSHVSWVDIDTDGDLDLAAGGWWDFARIFENIGGTLTTAPVWSSNRISVIENMFWGDIDNDALFDNGRARALGDGVRTFFSTGQAPVRSIDVVRVGGVGGVGGVVLTSADYCSHLANGWISLAEPPSPGEEVWIEYTYSADLDLGITTWDSNIGNFVHYNTRTPTSVSEPVLALSNLRAAPNPVRNATRVRYRGPDLGPATLVVFDAVGRRVHTLYEGEIPEGLHTWEWDRRDDRGSRAPSGVYFVRLSAHAGDQAIRVVLVD
jgi:hypothetical protein